jgi:hypothetical protein
MSIFRTLESIMDDGGEGREREWIGIIFDGGEEGMGIEEKRVAHGTE